MSKTANKTLPADEKFTLGGTAGKVRLVAVGAAVVGLGGAAAMTSGDMTTFGFAYLVGFAYFLSLSLGALFFVLIQHLSRAGWSVTVRRLAELMAANVVTMAVAALPLLVLVPHIWGHQWEDGLHHGGPYKWGKDTWLQPGFFVARLVAERP